MRTIRALWPFILWGATVSPAVAQNTINLSHDLIQLGIANQNMVPNMPQLNAEPLFLAALQYAQANPVQLVTADPGSYYFAPATADSAINVYFPPLSNVTFDFQGSTLYFNDGTKRGFDIEDCQNLAFKNFTIDYLAPAYTQVQLTSIDPTKGAFTYTTMSGWADPKTFITTPEFGAPQLLAVFFRNGEFVPRTGLTFINYPIQGQTAVAQPSDSPWTQSDVLSTLKPGDVMVVANAVGAEPIDVAKCDSMLFTNIEIRGGIGGINLFDTSNSTLDHIRIVPRPGALLGSASGGLMFFDPLQNDHIRNSYVTRTLDDGLGMGTDPPATVVSQPGTRQLVVQRNGTDHLPNGTPLSFVPIASAAELTGGVVVSQDPPDTPVDVVNPVQVTLTFDRDLPALSNGDQVFYSAPEKRGSGSTIEDNLVEDLGAGRGIYLGGLENVVAQRNVIRNSSNAGINIGEVSLIAGGGGAPSHGVTIQNNAIENVLGPQAAGSGGVGVSMAAILVDSQDQYFDYVSQPVNSNISILNNFVVGSGRAGIWVGEVNSGNVNGNFIAQWNSHPELVQEGTNPFPGDFALPLVTRFSQNVDTSGNVIDMSSTLQNAVSLNPASASPGGNASGGAFAVQVNLANFGWAAISDSSWLTVAAGASGTGNGMVTYSVAPNTSSSPRTGSIQVAGVAFTVTQAGAMNIPTFTAAGVTNAASYVSGTVSPGEIVTLFGANLGPASPAGATLDSNGLVSKQIGNTQVLFDGVPAPMIYTSANQTSAIVPFSVQNTSTEVTVSLNGVSSTPVTLAVAPSEPGVFTANGTGSGPGAFLNQDGSLNLPSNPAAKGSIVTLFATGAGQTSPPGTDGAIAIPPYAVPVLQVTVQIDGVSANIDYAGAAPGEVAGVLQVNATVPASVHSGTVPVVLSVGNTPSQGSVTLAVK